MWRDALSLLLSPAGHATAATPAAALTLLTSRRQASREVSRWITSHVATFPALTSRVAAALSNTAAPSAPLLDEREPEFVDLRQAVMKAAAAQSAPPQTAVAIVQNLSSSSSSAASNAQSSLALLSTLSRATAVSTRTTLSSPSSSAVVADALFTSLTASASAATPAVRAAATALYARCVAPLYVARTRGEQNGAPPPRHDLLSHEYQAFLLAARKAARCSRNDKSDALLGELARTYEQLPEKRPLTAVYTQCLIRHRRWEAALSLLASSSSPQSQAAMPPAARGALIGLNAAAGRWLTALEMLSEPQAAGGGTVSAAEHDVHRLRALHSVARLASSAASRTPPEFRHALQRLVQREVQRRAQSSSSSSSQNEVAAERDGAAIALALALSSKWREALQDFAMALSLAQSGNAGDGGADEGPLAAARSALRFDRAARRRVLFAAADGNRADVLAKTLRLLRAADDAQSLDCALTRAEAAALARHIAVDLRNPEMLARLREAWPSEATARTALHFETGLLAKRVVARARHRSGSASTIPFSPDAEREDVHLTRQFVTCLAMQQALGARRPPPRGVRIALLRVGRRLQAEAGSRARVRLASLLAVPATPSLRTALAELDGMLHEEQRLSELRRDVLRLCGDATACASPQQRVELIIQICQAKFPRRAYSAVVAKIQARMAASSSALFSSLHGSMGAQQTPSDTRRFFAVLADELVRVGESAAPELLAVVKHAMPLVPHAGVGGAASSSPSTTTHCVCTGLLGVLEQRAAQLTPSSSKTARRRVEALGRCVLRVLAVAPLASLHRLLHGGGSAAVATARGRQLAALARTVPFPLVPPAPAARAAILLLPQSRSASNRLTGDEPLAPGWVRGASDVLDLAAASAVASVAGESVEQHAKGGNKSKSKSKRQGEGQDVILWLLMQSAECRAFVRGETARIAGERSRRGLPLVAAQTIQAELWRHMGRVFACAAAAVAGDDDAQPAADAAEGRAPTAAAAAMSVAQFVDACACVLRESRDLSLAQAATTSSGRASEVSVNAASGVPHFCFRSALASNAVARRGSFQASFLASSCHVEDERLRCELVALLRAHCSHEGDSRADDVVPSFDGLWQRWKLLATAEGMHRA